MTLTAAAAEHARHIVNYSTQYDGKGGVKWKDEGGLGCSCGWTADREGLYRPWNKWHEHVAAAVLATVTTPADRTVICYCPNRGDDYHQSGAPGCVTAPGENQ